MKKNLSQAILILVLFLTNQLVEAQPGYQGRKFSVQTNLLFIPTLNHASYSREPGLGTFNTTGEASVDYVVSRRNSIGLSFRRFRTSNLNDYDEEGVSPYKLYTDGIGLQYRIYKQKNGNIAPLGRYFQLGAGVLFSQLKHIESSGPGIPFRMYALRIGAAKNRILFDRLILSYGWEISHLMPADAANDDELIGGATVFETENIQSMAHHRLWMHSLVNLKVSLGFLAF